MKKIRIAQVGTNGMTHSSTTFNSIRKQNEIFDLVGIAEPVEEWKHNLTKSPYKNAPQYTVDELLEMDDLDAVAIETNEEYLTEYAQMFADKGVAVHIEKPGSYDHDAYAKMVRTLKDKNLPFHLGYMYRFNPLVQRAYERIAAGDLGEIISVEAQMNCRTDTELRNWLCRHPGGMMYYLGCHLVDLVYRLQGLPEQVIPMNMATGSDDIDVKDFGFALLQYKKGASFVKTSGIEVNGFVRRQLVISGTKGTIEIKPLEMATENGRKSYGCYTTADMAKTWLDHSEKWESEEYDRLDAMMADFAALVRGDYENPYDHDYEIALHGLLMQCCGEK